MKRWEAHVWRFTLMGKSRQGNWYEGKFRWFWAAYLAARVMAFFCDCATPIYQSWGYGIAWGIKKI